VNGPAAPHLLSPRAARIFYNVADALVPPGPGGEPGAGDLDLVPELERRLRGEGVGAVRRLWLLLAILEAQPRATLRARRGFSWLPRAERRRILDAWRRSRIPARRRVVEWLARLVERCYAAETGCATPADAGGPSRALSAAPAGGAGTLRSPRSPR
jgi:hypothetical protein